MSKHTLIYLLENLKKKKDKVNFLNDLQNNDWIHTSSHQWLNQIEAVALGLQKLGIQKGDRIAIIANSSTYWLTIEFAIFLLGAISVPMFANASAENIEFQLKDAEINTLFIIGQEEWKTLTCASLFKNIITHKIKTTANTLELTNLLKQNQETKNSLLDNALNQIYPQDLATIIYTSGTSGKPKGVCLSHANLVSQIQGCQRIFHLNDTHRILCCLPLAHIFQKMTTYYFLSQRSSVYFLDEIQNLGNTLRSLKPHAMIVVPRILEKIHLKIKENIQNTKGLKGKLAKAAFTKAEQKDTQKKPSFLDFLYRKLVYRKFLTATGGQFILMVSGGAPIANHIYCFFLNIGLPLCQGYGLTEASPVIATNTLSQNKTGTVGPLFPEVQIKILSDGEICVQSKGIMQGYLNNPQATEEVLTKNHWLKTGDLGNLSNGYLSIIGRKKELFKTSNGKYISPLALESFLADHSLLEYAIIIANHRSFVTALLFPSEQLAAELKTKKQSLATFFENSKIKAQLDTHLETINKKQNQWEKIKKYQLIPEVLSIEAGYLTPKLSLRRSQIEKDFKTQIEDFYS